jgi:hypothetical protein
MVTQVLPGIPSTANAGEFAALLVIITEAGPSLCQFPVSFMFPPPGADQPLNVGLTPFELKLS